MRKSGSDPKVKKTLLRNYEQKILTQPKAIHESDSGSSKLSYRKEQAFDQPALCSSESLANYITDIRKSAPLPCPEELNIDQAQISAKITKKLNFHFNDRIYKNLVELNTDNANLKSRRDKKLVKNISKKKDLEPNIEDFCQDEKENDVCPDIPDVKHIIKPVRRMEDGSLHRLIASFEQL